MFCSFFFSYFFFLRLTCVPPRGGGKPGIGGKDLLIYSRAVPTFWGGSSHSRPRTKLCPPPKPLGGWNFAGPFSRESMGISVKVRDNQTGITNIYYSKTQAAKELSTSLDTVRRYIISGKPYKGRYLISII